MIDESTLTRALDEAATAYDEPPGARDAILAASSTARRPADAHAGTSRRGRSPRVLTAAAAAVVLVGVGSMVAVRSIDGSVPRLGTASRGAADGEMEYNAGKNGPLDAGAPAPQRDAFGSSGAGSVAGSAPVPQPPSAQGAPAAPQAGNLAKVVKTGSVEIVVGDGKVPATLARMETLVGGSRGFVADSKTQETGDSPSGVVTMRVPGSAYEEMLGRVRGLGEVRTVTSTGVDVTAEFVDTEARLKTLKQTRAVYETLMSRARSIGEVLSVQQQINGAQTQIEQLEGKLKVLRDQVAYATLTVSVFEESDELATLEEPGRLSSAWDRAKDNFGDGVEWVIAASGTVALLLLAGAVLLVGGLGARRLLRRRMI